MRRLLTLAMLVGACSAPADAPPQPVRAWERLRAALFVRTGPDGMDYGAEELDPLLFPSSTYLLQEPRRGEIASALDALLEAPDALAGLDPLGRALLQRELWSVFDWLVEHPAAATAELEARLARLLRLLALGADELQALPAPTDGAAGTPRGLFAGSQGWVRLGDARGRPMAPAHVFHAGGRSHFEVLLRLPGGRAATLAYLERLCASPAEPPQFPVGTAVALVRRLVLFDARGELLLTPIVESVQLRTYLVIAAPGDPDPFSPDLSRVQEVAEFHLTRDAGLRPVRAGEPDFSSFGTHGEDPFEHPLQPRHWIRRALQHCGGCHGQAGIYGLNSFTRMTSGPGTLSRVLPGHEQTLAVEGDPRQQLEATLAARRDSDSWRALFPR